MTEHGSASHNPTSMKPLFNVFALGLLVQFAAGFALGQVPSLGAPGSGVSVAFIKLFGGATTFTAKVDAKVLSSDRDPWLTLPMQAAASDGKLQLELLLENLKGKDVPEMAIANLKQVGMGRVITLVLPAKKASYIVYPGISSYVRTPFEKEALEENAQFEIEKTELGKERIGVNDCTKNRVRVSAKGVVLLEATTWNVASLRGFPMRIETAEGGRTLVMDFSEVQFVKPDSSKFEVPADYTEYANAQALMLGIMKRMAGEASLNSK